MPPKAKFTREEVVRTALEMVRENGMDTLSARNLSARLGSSASPIFTIFQSMEDVQQEVISAAHEIYRNYLREDMSGGKYPPYKASGMAYIRFAREEGELFKLLFMRDRSTEAVTEKKEEIAPLLELIQTNTGISEEAAYLFHLEMWLYVHGIAAMIATNYLDWDMEFVDQVLTDGYMGLKHRYMEENSND